MTEKALRSGMEAGLWLFHVPYCLFIGSIGLDYRLGGFLACSGWGAVIVPNGGPQTAFWRIFAVIVPLFGPMTALSPFSERSDKAPSLGEEVGNGVRGARSPMPKKTALRLSF